MIEPKFDTFHFDPPMKVDQIMIEDDSLSSDVIVIDGGLAGLRAAQAYSNAGIDVIVLSKVHLLRSHSVAAQGGVNAALGNAEVVPTTVMA